MSKLETQILPEIVNDELFDTLESLASQADIKTVLEIGTGSGEGSTLAIFKGLSRNKNKNISFHTIEISKQRAESVIERYKGSWFMHVHVGCSVSLDDYATDSQIEKFYNSKKTALNKYPLELVLGWKKEELDYITENNVECGIINKIEAESKVKNFDMVLIDGSEFTGHAELKMLIGAKYIVLDDINAFKNNDNYNLLAASKQYSLIKENWTLRNGFAVFKKQSKEV